MYEQINGGGNHPHTTPPQNTPLSHHHDVERVLLFIMFMGDLRTYDYMAKDKNTKYRKDVPSYAFHLIKLVGTWAKKTVGIFSTPPPQFESWL